MIILPEINPVAIQIGVIKIHWYGLMYLFGFVAAWWLGCKRGTRADFGFSKEQVSDLIFYCAIGVIIGGRIGYMFFYDFASLRENPLSLFTIWNGGMSFHGGLIGVLLAFAYFARKNQRPFFNVADFLAPMVPLGLAAGRIGNFINAELWGRVSDVPWAVLYPNAGNLPRHPSEIYEFLLEGVILFIVLWTYSKKPRPCGSVSGLFLVGYGVARFFCEFFREPDAQIGFVAFNWMTKGQLLSIPMILFGLLLLVYTQRSTARSNA